MHVLTVWSYASQPDHLAAFTVFPILFWGGIGLTLSVIAFCFLRAPLSLIVTAVWAVTLSVAMDEAKVVSNFNHPRIAVECSVMLDGQRIVRIYATRQLQQLSCGVLVSKKTDHRIVIADLRLRQ